MRIPMSGLLLLSVSLAACSPNHAPAPPPPEKTVFDPLTRQLERAKQVQSTVDQNSEETRRKIEAAESGTPTG
jgi:hypothetical protein